MAWTLLIWTSKYWVEENIFSHLSHFSSLFWMGFWWISIWLFKSDDLTNNFSQISHLFLASNPWWFHSKWHFSSSISLNSLWQISYSWFSLFLWIAFSCFFKIWFVEKHLPHNVHLYFSPKCTLRIWFLSELCEVSSNSLLQMWHLGFSLFFVFVHSFQMTF